MTDGNGSYTKWGASYAAITSTCGSSRSLTTYGRAARWARRLPIMKPFLCATLITVQVVMAWPTMLDRMRSSSGTAPRRNYWSKPTC